jgi:hypothetical protein
MVEPKPLNTGAWNLTAQKKYNLDEPLASLLRFVLHGSDVVEFGAGDGRYQNYISDVTKSYQAYDGAPMIEQRTSNRVKYLDLATSNGIATSFSYGICLETMEHIPRRFENNAVDILSNSTKDGLILSWARQGGNGHFNRRPILYVLSRFKRLFYVDSALTLALRETATLPWFRSNIIVFRRRLSLLDVQQKDQLLKARWQTFQYSLRNVS